MERRYREITLKRRVFLKRSILIGIFLLCAWGILSIREWKIWEGVWVVGTNYMTPAIFKYQKVKTVERLQPILLESASEVLANETNVEIILEPSKELSLLQENIYMEQAYAMNHYLDLEGLDTTFAELTNKPLSIAKYANITDLIKDYYIIDASTSPDSKLLQVDYMANYDCKISKESEGPQILIYHSHSQEGFADSKPGDESTSIVGAGSRLTRLLEEEYGFEVLHHKGIYDVPSRDNAYSNALPKIEQILSEHPSIQVVIDLHRDATNEGTKLVKTINGKNYARFMFFNGICRSTKGPITYLSNPYLKENLAFSFQAQTIAEHYFPGITRKIYLKAWRYNMHLKPRNMLIELGAQTNTVEEIMNTCDILAFVLNQVLSGQ